MKSKEWRVKKDQVWLDPKRHEIWTPDINAVAMIIMRNRDQNGTHFSIWAWGKEGKTYCLLNMHPAGLFIKNVGERAYTETGTYHVSIPLPQCRLFELCTCAAVTKSVRAWILCGKRMGIGRDMTQFIARIVWNERFD